MSEIVFVRFVGAIGGESGDIGGESGPITVFVNPEMVSRVVEVDGCRDPSTGIPRRATEMYVGGTRVLVDGSADETMFSLGVLSRHG